MDLRKKSKPDLIKEIKRLKSRLDKLSDDKPMATLDEREQKFRDIFESFQDIYFRCNLKGNITMVSPSVNELLGYDPENVLGNNVTNYYLYTSKTKDLIRQLVKNKSVRNFEASIITNSGKILQCICNVRLIHNKRGNQVEIEGVARDITELKRTTEELLKQKEIAEKSLRVKERFLANMSHEIRTPMNGIIGMLDLLETTDPNEEQRQYLKSIKKSSGTLMEILNDILDISKIEAGKMRLKKVRVDLNEMMNKLFSLFSRQAESRGLDLNYSIKNLPEFLIFDETRVLQILSNLTSNAIKFTDKGGRIHIAMKEISKLDQNKLKVKIEVTDSGIGIATENQKKLFDSFTQLDDTSTKAFGGTGLGLSISKELAQLMRGDIGVDSTLSKGSTFWFTFLAEIPTEPVKRKPKSSESINEISEEHFTKITPKVLLVDDNPVNQQVAIEILKKSGCEVIAASSGPEAIEKVKNNRFDVVFMDIQMPEMNGVAATKHLKEMSIKNLPPIVAMTAYAMKEDEEKFIRQGLDDYIAKPIRAKKLIGKVKKWVYNQKEDKISDAQNEFGNKVLNKETIAQLKKYGGEEIIEQVLSDFNKETKSELKDIEQEFTLKNYKNILSKLHTIKGNAGTLGAEKIAALAQKVEKDLKDNLLDSLELDIQRLKIYFKEFQDLIASKFKITI